MAGTWTPRKWRGRKRARKLVPGKSNALKRRIGRVRESFHYFRSFPECVAPFLAPHVLDSAPLAVDKQSCDGFVRSRALRTKIRRVLGIRVILTGRYFLDYSATIAARQSIAVTKPSVDATGVNVVGYLRSETGVGEVARGTVRALRSAAVQVSVVSVDAGDSARQSDNSISGYQCGFHHPMSIFQVNADLTYVVGAHLPDGALEGRTNIAWWAWELDEFPASWGAAFRPYAEIWALSDFSRDAIAACAPVPVVTMPVVIDIPEISSGTRSKFALPANAFVVLFMFDARSVIERKNPWSVVDAFERAFRSPGSPHDAVLVIKATNLGEFPDDAARLHTRISEVGGMLIEEYQTRTDTYELLGSSDVYISLHRCEGFGLTLAEAMLLNIPVIATAYSGNLDFMNDGNSWLVPYSLRELDRDYHPYKRHSRWAEPDISAAARYLKEIFNNQPMAAERAANGRNTILERYSTAAVGASIAYRLGQIATTG